MTSESNQRLIKEYLDIAVHSPDDPDRARRLFTSDCTWLLMPPGYTFRGLDELSSFMTLAMRRRGHDDARKIEIRNWFANDEFFCVEYVHRFLLTRFRVSGVMNICLVCHMRDGKFDRVNEYVDASGSLLARLGLRTSVLRRMGRSTHNGG